MKFNGAVENLIWVQRTVKRGATRATSSAREIDRVFGMGLRGGEGERLKSLYSVSQVPLPPPALAGRVRFT